MGEFGGLTTSGSTNLHAFRVLYQGEGVDVTYRLTCKNDTKSFIAVDYKK